MSTLVAVALLLLLAAPQGSALAAAGPDFLGLKGFDVSRIEIVRGNQSLVLQNASGVWQVLRPVQDRADQQAVADLLNRLSNLTIADVFTGDHPSFGFNPPTAVVRLIGRNGETKELQIGNLRSPVSLFVRAADSDTVYAISNVSLAGIGEYPMAFVDANLMRVTAENVRRIRVESAPGVAGSRDDEPRTIQVERRGVAWMFDSGEIAFDVEHFFRSVRLIQATGQIEGGTEEAQFYPAPGTARITLEFDDGQRVVLDVGNKTDDGQHYYFKVSGRDDVYIVPAFHAQHIVKQAVGINDSLLAFDPARVKELSITAGGNRTVYTRNNSGVWESNRTVVFNFEPLLEAVASVGASRRLEEQPGVDYGFGTAPNAVDVGVVFTDGNRLTLSLGAELEGGAEVYLQTSARDGIYVGPASSITELLGAASRVRTRLFPVAMPDVAYVRIQRGGAAAGDGTLVERSGDGWTRRGAAVDASRVQTLVNALAGMGADSLPPIPDDPSALGFYPAANSTRITIGFADGTERFLDIGAAVQVGSGWFATTSYYVRVSDLEDMVAFVKEQVVRSIVNAAGALE